MIPLILSGGSGTRLWPASRSNYPKQFVDVLGDSLLEMTISRVGELGKPWILTTKSLQSPTMRIAKLTGVPNQHCLFEPFGRNTAAAIAWFCHSAKILGLENEVAAVFPADHLVRKPEALREALSLAESCALKGRLVTLGIQPDYPATGFGYIERGESFDKNSAFEAFRVRQFCEKPPLPRAQEFLQSGKHYWNAGIFVFQVAVMVELFKKYAPDVWSAIELIKKDLTNLDEQYKKCPNISIDYAIAEKSSEVVCIPGDFGWSDVGSWDELSRVLPSNKQVHQLDASGNFVWSQQPKTVALIDVQDLIVADTKDGLLICKKESSQKIKNLVEAWMSSGAAQALQTGFEMRPWGEFEVLADRPHYKVKRILVDANSQISYQSHQKRAETWIITHGEATVVLDDRRLRLTVGQSVHIPIGARHQIINDSNDIVEFVEVQTGSYFGEEDITRYHDIYNRTT